MLEPQTLSPLLKMDPRSRSLIVLIIEKEIRNLSEMTEKKTLQYLLCTKNFPEHTFLFISLREGGKKTSYFIDGLRK